MTNHPGKITILIHDDRVEMEITDDVSGVRIAELTIPGSEFLAAMGRQAYRTCAVALYHGPIGYLHETKRVPIPFPRRHYASTDKAEAQNRSLESLALAPYCVDGWEPMSTGSNADYRNGHRINVERTKAEGTRDITVYDVAFSRYVHPKTGQVWQAPDLTLADVTITGPGPSEPHTVGTELADATNDPTGRLRPGDQGDPRDAEIGSRS